MIAVYAVSRVQSDQPQMFYPRDIHPGMTGKIEAAQSCTFKIIVQKRFAGINVQKLPYLHKTKLAEGLESVSSQYSTDDKLAIEDALYIL